MRRHMLHVLTAAFGPSRKWRDVRHESEMRTITDMPQMPTQVAF